MTSLSQLYYLLDEQKESDKSYDIVLKLIQEKEGEVLSQEIIPSLKEVSDILLQNFRNDVIITISHSAGSISTVKAEITGTDLTPKSAIQEVVAHPISNVGSSIKPNKSITKNAPTRLRVTRSDGSTIEDYKAANTLCLVIKEIGPEIVEKIGLSVDGQNIILHDLGPDRRGDRHDIGDNFFVNTHSSTSAKKNQLERIFKALHLSWKVEIIK